MSSFRQTIGELLRAGRTADAQRALLIEIQRNPDDAALRRMAVQFYMRTLRFERALEHAEQAIAIAPADGLNHEARGSVLAQLNRFDEAREALEHAVELTPSHAGAHNGLGALAAREGRYADAESHYVRAIQANPQGTAALCNFATMLKDTGRGDEAAALIGPALERLPNDIAVQWSGAVMSNYAPSLTGQQVFDQHRRFGAAVKQAVGAQTRTFTNPRNPDGNLSIGFLSPDMRRHSVAFFLLPLIQAMDRDQFTVFCYSASTSTDDITDRFMAAADAWRDVSHLTDSALVDLLRQDGIDVLVECAGLFQGARPAVMAMRGAPVQVTWLGYPNTTGIDQIDYRLVDAITDPPGTDHLAVEELVRLDDCFICFDPIDETALPTSREDGPITFGCFNHLSKYNDALLDTWAALLKTVPDAHLLIKSMSLQCPDVQRSLRRAFDRRGIDAKRIAKCSYVESHSEHRCMYGRMDIALDTFPYCGTTTTCEALWMGVPVVTLVGNSHPGRVGASLLHAIGRSQWIADSTQAYVSIASGLAGNRTALAALRYSLRQEMANSTLCDAVGHARRFQETIRSLWRRKCSAAVR